MGEMYNLTCSKCGHNEIVYTGKIFSDVNMMTDVLFAIQRGNAGREARAFLSKNQPVYMTLERKLFLCKSCNLLQPRLTPILHSLNATFEQKYYCAHCDNALALCDSNSLALMHCPECGEKVLVDGPFSCDITSPNCEVRPAPCQRADNSTLITNCIVPIPGDSGPRGNINSRHWLTNRQNMPVGLTDGDVPLFERYKDINTARYDRNSFIVMRSGTGHSYDVTLVTCPIAIAGIGAEDIAEIENCLQVLIAPLEDVNDSVKTYFMHGENGEYVSSEYDLEAPFLSSIWVHPLLEDHSEMLNLMFNLHS